MQDRLSGAQPFTAIYSSPLRRARETAAIFEGAGVGWVRLCSELREIDCGTLDGVPIDLVQRLHPEVWAANQRQVDDKFRWPGGESYREFRCRCLIAVRTLVREHRNGRVAVVTHAGVISQIVGFLAGTSPAQWERYRTGNTALTELDWERDRGRIVRFNDRRYLQPPS